MLTDVLIHSARILPTGTYALAPQDARYLRVDNAAMELDGITRLQSQRRSSRSI